MFQTPAVAARQVDGMESGDSEDVTELDVLEQRWKVFADFELYKSFLAIESTKKKCQNLDEFRKISRRLKLMCSCGHLYHL